MSLFKRFDRLAVRLTLAFLLAAVLGVALVAVLAYRSASGELASFVDHMQIMQGMMGTPSLSEVEGEFLANLGRNLWIAGIAGIALAIVLGSFFTRQIVAPLGKITAAARRITAGDLAQKVEISACAEFVELGDSFNTMAATLSRDRQLRQNMVADIAHELRTPLSVLRGNTEAMIDGVLEANPENLESLKQETLQLARLVEDLRTLSLAEAGHLHLSTGATDLADIVRHVVDGFQTEAATRRVSLAVELPDGLPLVEADADRTAQVLANLLSNGLRYTPEGGHVTVTAGPGSDGVFVTVTDSGAGIATEDLAHVFDRFYRVDRSRTRTTGGSGLGLAIVEQLVRAQKGRVWAESTLGEGSTFTFELPLVVS